MSQRSGCLLGHLQGAAALACLDHVGAPFPGLTIEQEHGVPHALPHHPKEVMRLRLTQRNGLPFPQRVLYIKPDLRCFHGANI